MTNMETISPPPLNIGDFLVCYNPLEKREGFRCIIIEEKSDRYETIVLLHDEDNGFNPGDKFSLPKPCYQDLFRAPVNIGRTHWLIEEVKGAA